MYEDDPDAPIDTGYSEELDGAAEQAPVSVADNLKSIAEFDGNLLDLLSEDAASKLGAEVVREYDHDETSRKGWLDGVERAIKAAKQDPEQKDYPFERASNIKFPILTSAAIQFGSRAYGAITRGDQPSVCKVLGDDPKGLKAERANRLTRWNNYQLMYLMDEWDSGTDELLHTIPISGSSFRKVYWDASLGRCVAEHARAQQVCVHNDSPSFDRAPRQTQPVNFYPHEIDRLVRMGKWAKHKYDADDTTDNQKAVEYLEQLRYIDLDDDGLAEPYIVTVEKCYETPVRIDPAFHSNSLMVTEMGDVETIMRESPWIDYKFLPDIDGSVYGMGFGQLLETLGSAINSMINQIVDAGTRQNTQGGFIAQSLRLKGARGGSMRINPGEYKFVNAGAQRLADGIHTLQFPGPSSAQFQLVEFLLGAAQDITAVKDVLTGDAPSGQAMGATLALIEQGLQVFSTIYTRIYRSQRRELRLITRLNGRYLNPQVYLDFQDSEKLNQLVQGGYDPRMEFDLKGMDMVPSADPKSVTDMQRMMRAQYLGQFIGQPGINNQEIQRRQMQAANIEDIDKLFSQGPDPMQELAAEEKKHEVAGKKADVIETLAKAEKARQEAESEAFERGTAAGMAGGMGGMEGFADDAGVLPMPQPNAGGPDGSMGRPDAAAVEPGGLVPLAADDPSPV